MRRSMPRREGDRLGTRKPVNVPSTYSLATCNHEDACHATITGFSSEITVTRVR